MQGPVTSSEVLGSLLNIPRCPGSLGMGAKPQASRAPHFCLPFDKSCQRLHNSPGF